MDAKMSFRHVETLVRFLREEQSLFVKVQLNIYIENKTSYKKYLWSSPNVHQKTLRYDPFCHQPSQHYCVMTNFLPLAD